MLYRVVIGLYGLINVAGGIIGLIVGRSPWSLIIGGLVGLFLIYLAWAAETKPAFAMRSAGMVTFLLMAFWVFRYTSLMRTGEKTMMAMGNLGLSIVVLAILAGGHMLASKKHNA